MFIAGKPCLYAGVDVDMEIFSSLKEYTPWENLADHLHCPAYFIVTLHI